MNSDFNFFIPVDDSTIEKAAKEPLVSRYDNMVIQGEASDNSEDIDGEILEPSGYVVDHFVKNGNINYEHLAKKSPKFIIGNPVDAKVKGNKFFIKGKLWKNSEVARDLWDKLIEMKEEGINRKLGWSIEGKSLAKDPMNPKHITKALITNVALTFSPTNQNSWADIVKGTQKEDFVEPVYDKEEVKDYIFEFERDGKKFRVGKDYKVKEVIEKAMDIGSVAALVPESLEGKVKNIALVDIKKSLDNVLNNNTLMNSCPEIKGVLLEKIKNL